MPPRRPPERASGVAPALAPQRRDRAGERERQASNSIVMSTFRNATSAGTNTFRGAKFKIPRTPAWTSASATCCAALIGVAMTPMSKPPLEAASASVSTSFTVSPPTRWPIRAGSRSKTATTSKPWSANPRYASSAEPMWPAPTTATRQRRSSPRMAADLLAQVRDVVAESAPAERSEIREVLADLGGGDALALGEPARGDHALAFGVDLVEHAVVVREPPHAGFGDGAARATRDAARAGASDRVGRTGRRRSEGATRSRRLGDVLDDLAAHPEARRRRPRSRRA